MGYYEIGVSMVTIIEILTEGELPRSKSSMPSLGYHLPAKLYRLSNAIPSNTPTLFAPLLVRLSRKLRDQKIIFRGGRY